MNRPILQPSGIAATSTLHEHINPNFEVSPQAVITIVARANAKASADQEGRGQLGLWRISAGGTSLSSEGAAFARITTSKQRPAGRRVEKRIII